MRERVWHQSQRIRELADGRVELSFRAGGLFEITRWVLGWGDAAEVISPESLRTQILAALRSATAVYDTPQS